MKKEKIKIVYKVVTFNCTYITILKEIPQENMRALKKGKLMLLMIIITQKRESRWWFMFDC